jgi:hypothetical protein
MKYALTASTIRRDARGRTNLRGERLFLAALIVFFMPSLLSQTLPQQTGTTSDEVSLRIIVVSSPEKAQQVLAELQKGEDFATLAKRESIDSTAGGGGAMGKVSLSVLHPRLRDALQGVGSGQFSPVVQIAAGYAILEVVRDGPANTTNLGVNQAASAIGSVKYTFQLGGFAEVESDIANFSKPVGWNRDLREICEIRKQSISAERKSLEKFLSPENEPARASHPPEDQFYAHYSLGELGSYDGKMDAAIEQYKKAAVIAASSLPPQAALGMDEGLGIAYLHKSEMENDVYRAPGDRCLLPTRPGSARGQTIDSEKGIEYFLKYLAQKPDDLEVRWLLNVAYMTLGAYPDKVPKRYLIPPSVFASAEDVGRFRDVAPQAGLNSFSTAGGVIVDDFENNGRFDVVVSSFNACEPLHYYHNNGDGTFTEQGAKAGLSEELGGLNIIQTDYNNDGCIDILVLRGGWEFGQRKSLLRNNCNGTFTDVTAASGLDQPTESQTAVWVDINNDGWLDLFVGNEDAPAQLFLNKGDGTFEDISHAAHVDRVMFSKGVAAADYDNDGWPDLYVSNFNGNNFLYHNNHDNTFTEVAEHAGVPGSGRSFATWFFDYDNDGWPDLFVTSYFTSLEETARTYLGLPHNAATLKLYKNLGNGTFRDVTAEVGLDKVFMPMGANFGDIDNDGFLDIFLGNGTPSYVSLVPSVLFRNHDGKYFVDVTNSSGTGEWHKGHAVAFADLDNRGDEDIVFEVGGVTPADSHALRLFENPGHGNDWISLKLVGVQTNRAAIGARIKVAVENEGHEARSIYRTVGSGGSFGASPLTQHIGLGKSARIVQLVVWWPTSKTFQHFTDVEKNQFLEIKEFAQDYAKLERKPYRLGGARRGANVLAKHPVVAPVGNH